jgi:GrpB-like predicted nucleotidyltransferase (UPF0157 family)
VAAEVARQRTGEAVQGTAFFAGPDAWAFEPSSAPGFASPHFVDKGNNPLAYNVVNIVARKPISPGLTLGVETASSVCAGDVAPSEDAWSERGEREARKLDEALAGWLLAPVEHVDSTAVPGLTAKPILDLQAAVADLDECAFPIAEALDHHGWEYVPPDLDHRPWRRFFVQVILFSRNVSGRTVWRCEPVERSMVSNSPAPVALPSQGGPARDVQRITVMMR